MPMCGFNQEMLEGINEFHEGLVERIDNNSSCDINEEDNKNAILRI